MKIKHSDPSNPNSDSKRGRGRPRKDGYGLPGGRLDPTSELFLRHEHREGGPTDPLHSFAQNISLLFADKFQAPDLHPMYQVMKTFAFETTPGQNEDEDMERPKYKDVSYELSQMAEPRKNMLNCEHLFSLYLRECSSQVKPDYYSKMTQFVLMFRDCLNLYGW